jgi:hypothetical protein
MAIMGIRHTLRILLALIAFVILEPFSNSAWAQFYGKQTIVVSTAAGFIKAVGSDRTIRLAGLPMDLSEIVPFEHPQVRWSPRGKTHSPIIHNVRNLRIIGIKNASELRSTSQHSFILGFENAKNVELRDLKIGAAAAFNAGNLLSLSRSTNVLLRNCHLSGAGSRALKLDQVARFVTRNSRFTDCSNLIVSVGRSANLLFRQTHFTNNRGRWGGRFVDTYDVQFDRCTFSENSISSALLSASSSDKIRVYGGMIGAAEQRVFTDAPKSVTLETQKSD